MSLIKFYQSFSTGAYVKKKSPWYPFFNNFFSYINPCSLCILKKTIQFFICKRMPLFPKPFKFYNFNKNALHTCNTKKLIFALLKYPDFSAFNSVWWLVIHIQNIFFNHDWKWQSLKLKYIYTQVNRTTRKWTGFPYKTLFSVFTWTARKQEW